MKRRLLNLLTTLSLLLCVAVVAMWVRSHFVGDIFYVSRFQDDREWTFRVRDELRVARGVAGLTRSVASGPRATYRASVEKTLSQDAHARPPFHQTLKPTRVKQNHGIKDFTFCGFACGRTAYTRGDGSVCAATLRVTIPLWSLAAVAAAPLALRGVGRLRTRTRLAPGLCRRCGYDLRATPGRCPEGGTIAAPVAGRP